MHLILTGATGAVGSSVLLHALSSPQITRLSILSRRPITFITPTTDPTSKANVIIQKDFTSYPPEVLEQLKGAKACIWAQGISQTQVNKEEYIKITYDYPVLAAKTFSKLSDPFVFVYVSGEGADPTEKSRALFGKIKGRCEKDLISLPLSEYPSLRVYNARPAAVDPPAVATPPLFPDRNTRWPEYLLPIFRLVLPRSLHSPGLKLAEALVDLAVRDGEPFEDTFVGIEKGSQGRTLGNKSLRTLVGLPN